MNLHNGTQVSMSSEDESKTNVNVATEMVDKSDSFATAEPVDDATLFVQEREGKFEITEADEKAALRRNDFILLPTLFFLATMGAVDKVSLGTAALYGIRDHLTTFQYTWVSSILFIGSLFGVFPLMYLQSKYRLGKVMSICSTIWSGLTLLMPACNSYGGFLALRFLTGVVEAAIVPGCTLMVTRFYRKSEQGVRLGFVFAFASSVINGFLSWLIYYFGDGLPKWKYLYLLIGSISFSFSVFTLWFLPDTPMNARYLSEKHKFIIVKKVIENRTGVQTNTWSWSQFREAVFDVKAYIIFLFNIGINIPNGGLSAFSAIIIASLNFSARESSLMTIPTGVIATIATVVINYFAGRFTNKRILLAILGLTIPLIGAIISYVVPETSVGARLLGLYLMYFYFAPYVVLISLSQANTSGNTKKSVVYGINYLGYAVGALTGGQVYNSGFTGGFIAMICAYVACILLSGCYWLVCTYQNKQKLKVINADEELKGEFEALKDKTEDVNVLLDVTDKEQKTFLYTK